MTKKAELVDGAQMAVAEARPVRRDEHNSDLIDERVIREHQLVNVETIHHFIEWLSEVVANRVEQKLAERRSLEMTPRRWLPLGEAARELGRTPKAVERLVGRGRNRAVRPPGERRLFIEFREIQGYIERSRARAI